MRKRLPLPVWLPLALLWLHCAPPPAQVEHRVTHDLLAELTTAELTTEIPGIDFGTIGGRQFLGRGFSADEFDQRLERPFVWGIGEHSEVRLPILRPRDGELILEARPFNLPGAAPQTLQVSLNGEVLQHFELRPGLQTYRIALPASAQRVGANQLVFRHGRHHQPSQHGGSPKDHRSLATSFFDLRWAQASTAVGVQPQVDLESARLFLPQGLRLDLYLALEGGSRLRADSWAFRGDGHRFRLSVRSDGGDEQVITELTEPPKAGSIALPGEGHRIVRLSLESLASEGASTPLDPQLGLLWHRPRIETTATASSSANQEATDATAPVDRTSEEAHGTRPPDVILYLIDTLRADHLGCYGYGRPTSPHLDSFAEEGVLFEHAIAQSSWTRASVASLWTGLSPVAHGTNLRNEVLNDDALTLPELLRRQGYQTAAFLSNPNVSERFGFHQGFDHLEDLSDVDTDAHQLHDLAARWLRQRDRDAPFFLYIHTIDPHSPYDPPGENRRRFAPQVEDDVVWTPKRLPDAVLRRRADATPEQMAEMVGLYDGEIAYADAAFGEFRALLEAEQLYESSWITVLSDHGEEFFEHGALEHGKNLHVETLHVPWIVKPPGRPGEDYRSGRIAETVQHIDLLPTLSRALGLTDGTSPAAGRDLSPFWRTVIEDPVEEPSIYSFLHLDDVPRVSLIEGGWKLIHRITPEGGLREARLYHLEVDPRELEDLSSEHPIRRRYLSTQIRRHLDDPEGRLESTTTEIDDALRRRLEALGYLQ